MTEVRRNVLILLFAVFAITGYIIVSEVVVDLPTEPKNRVAVNDETLKADLMDSLQIEEGNSNAPGKYHQIEAGMTYEDVSRIMSRSGEKAQVSYLDRQKDVYLWAVESGYVEITFENSRVIQKKFLEDEQQ